MTSKDEKEFALLMASLAEIFDSGGELSSVKVELYFRLLENYVIEDIKRGIDEIMRNRVYASLPKPAEIIRAIEGDGNEKAILAWEKLDRAVRQVGPYQSVQFDDPVIHSIVKFLGGWEKICDVPEDEWKWKQKEFERLYTIMAKRGDHPQYLLGITEWGNMVDYSDNIPNIVRIGFPPQEIKCIETTKLQKKEGECQKLA